MIALWLAHRSENNFLAKLIIWMRCVFASKVMIFNEKYFTIFEVYILGCCDCSWLLINLTNKHLFSLGIENATRFCHDNGTWDNYTDYDKCLHITATESFHEFTPNIELPTYIYVFGYIFSLISLSLALVVFVYFK